MTDTLKKVDEIIEEYSKPHSMIDNGNLFFACTTYQAEYKKLQTELAQLREKCAEYEKTIEWCKDQCGYASPWWNKFNEVLEKWKGKGLIGDDDC